MVNCRTIKNKGFTLIELMVVVAIIGMLTGLVSFNFQQARVRARDVQRKSELAAIRDALEMYKNDQSPQTFPATDSFEGVLVPNYIKELPIDPLEKASPGNDVWMNYSYTKGTGLDYTLQACLENASDSDAKDGSRCPDADTGEGVIYEITP
jgi:prepilin-type N-terminal cleavage/methylation domain-containing protein